MGIMMHCVKIERRTSSESRRLNDASAKILSRCKEFVSMTISYYIRFKRNRIEVERSTKPD